MLPVWRRPPRACPMRTVLLALGLVLAVLAGSAAAQTSSPSAGAAAPPAEADPSGPPVAVRDLLRLLDNPGVRGWLERQRSDATTPAAAATTAAPPAPAAPDQLATRLEVVRVHLR